MNARALRQISISSTPEAEEAVVELVQRVFGLTPSIYRQEESDEIVVTVYSPQKNRPDRLELDTLAAGLKQIKRCGLDIGSASFTVRKVKQQDWVEAWKHHFKPIEIGHSLLIKPSWSSRRARKGQAIVVLDPGLSFGTGHHPTTGFCLEQLAGERHADEQQSLLDLGTGSGILAIAAAKLGYHPIQALDADREALRVARANARKNQALNRIRLVRADLTRLPVHSEHRYHLVCANLTFEVLLSERKRILNRLRPEGKLVLAGILRTEFTRVARQYAEDGMRLLSAKASLEWKSGVFAFDQRV